MKVLLERTTRNVVALTLAGVSVGMCLALNMPKAQKAPAQNKNAAGTQTATAKIVKAATTFLATLTSQQSKRVLFAFNDEQQRARWSNFPTGIVQRAGLNMGELNPTQRSAAQALVASALSRRGYEKVQQIVAADEVLKQSGGGGRPNGGPPNGGGGPSFGGPPNGGPPNGGTQKQGGPPPFGGNSPVPGQGGRRRGGGPGFGGGLLFGKDLYYISILGTPSEKEPWMLQFGGHHLALNITIIGEQGILTPTLTGAQPGLYTVGGKTVRPLGQESDKAIALLNALDETQRKQAILNYRVGDLVLGPGQDGRTIVPEGLKVSAMNEKQRAMLLDVIAEWSGIVHESAAAARMADIKAGLGETWFAWSGPTTVQPGHNITAYYRIQGPKLVIEYAPQQMGGDPSNHIHTIYRDPTNDYGRGLTAK